MTKFFPQKKLSQKIEKKENPVMSRVVMSRVYPQL